MMPIRTKKILYLILVIVLGILVLGALAADILLMKMALA